MPEELEFEKPLLELENRIAELRASSDPLAASDEIAALEERLRRLQQRTYASLTPGSGRSWPATPSARTRWTSSGSSWRTSRASRGSSLWRRQGHRRRGSPASKASPWWWSASRRGGTPARTWRGPSGCPEGYRKALRLMKQAEKFAKPVFTFIDTPGAYPGLCAEERGQAEAIARNLREMAGLRTPVIAVVTGEGGSGGALAIGVADRVLMLEYAIYSVISPEGFAAILWGDAAKAPEAAELLRLTAPDLQRLGVIDGIVPEPVGGAHRNWEETAAALRQALRDHLWELKGKTPDQLLQDRYDKFRKIGVFEETA